MKISFVQLMPYPPLPDDPEEPSDADLDGTRPLAYIGKFSWPIPDLRLRMRTHRITAATLLLWRAQDTIVPQAYGEEFQVLDKCGRLPNQERPDECISAVSRFLKEG